MSQGTGLGAAQGQYRDSDFGDRRGKLCRARQDQDQRGQCVCACGCLSVLSHTSRAGRVPWCRRGSQSGVPEGRGSVVASCALDDSQGMASHGIVIVTAPSTSCDTSQAAPSTLPPHDGDDAGWMKHDTSTQSVSTLLGTRCPLLALPFTGRCEEWSVGRGCGVAAMRAA